MTASKLKRTKRCHHIDIKEISLFERIVYKGDKIIIPNPLQKKIEKIGQYLGHLRRTKCKQLRRERYWFPKMKNMIDRIIDQCYKFKVVSSYPQPEPIKLSDRR